MPVWRRRWYGGNILGSGVGNCSGCVLQLDCPDCVGAGGFKTETGNGEQGRGRVRNRAHSLERE